MAQRPIDRRTIDQIASYVEAIPSKYDSPDRPLSVKELAEQLRPQIEHLTHKGYTLREVAEIFKDAGQLDVSITTLQSYLHRRKARRKFATPKKPASGTARKKAAQTPRPPVPEPLRAPVTKITPLPVAKKKRHAGLLEEA